MVLKLKLKMQLNHPIDEQSKLPMGELVEQRLLGYE